MDSGGYRGRGRSRNRSWRRSDENLHPSPYRQSRFRWQSPTRAPTPMPASSHSAEWEQASSPPGQSGRVVIPPRSLDLGNYGEQSQPAESTSRPSRTRQRILPPEPAFPQYENRNLAGPLRLGRQSGSDAQAGESSSGYRAHERDTHRRVYNWTAPRTQPSVLNQEVGDVPETLIEEANAAMAQGIREVWRTNVAEQFREMTQYLDRGFTFVAFDVEFPGNPIAPPSKHFEKQEDLEYEYLSSNVNRSVPIQIGFSLFDSRGQYPPGIHTWQFNFHFVLPSKYQYKASQANQKVNWTSIEFLEQEGYNFDDFSFHGISYEHFGALITSSVTPLKREDITWLSFQGGKDFAYLIKLMNINQTLPQTRTGFLEETRTYFPQLFDLRYMAEVTHQNTHRGLNGIAHRLGISRDGQQHHAGSDARVTGLAYFQIRERWYENSSTRGASGSIYGLGNTLRPDAELEYPYVSSVKFYNRNKAPGGATSAASTWSPMDEGTSTSPGQAATSSSLIRERKRELSPEQAADFPPLRPRTRTL